MACRTSGSERRENLRQQLWPKETCWTGENERGWFKAPRTLPLLLGLLGSKEISGNQDPAPAYVELLARHLGEGVIEMSPEADHAFAAGYYGPRGVRTWRERMRILQEAEFIRVAKKGNREFGYVLLVHPAVAVQRLHDAGRVPDQWMQDYATRRIETKEAMPAPAPPKILSLRDQVRTA